MMEKAVILKRNSGKITAKKAMEGDSVVKVKTLKTVR